MGATGTVLGPALASSVLSGPRRQQAQLGLFLTRICCETSANPLPWLGLNFPICRQEARRRAPWTPGLQLNLRVGDGWSGAARPACTEGRAGSRHAGGSSGAGIRVRTPLLASSDPVGLLVPPPCRKHRLQLLRAERLPSAAP